jgi:murein DD-endopeptidase MepM/ murein hydrolase activator NlpD
MSVSSLIPLGSRLAALGVVALSVSACSQTDRFAYDPFSNPFNGKETTGTVSSAPSGGVSSQPLPPPGGYQPTAYAPQQQSYAPYQQSNYQQNTYQQQSYRAAPPPPPARPAPLPQYTYNAQKGGWSAEGGKTIVVQPGDTAYGLGTRHGVPASAILEANNLPPGAALTAGQRLVIPSYRGQNAALNQTASLSPRPPAEKPRTYQASAGRAHIVQPGETLFSISRKYDVPARELAETNQVDMSYHVRAGEKISIPGDARVVPVVHRTNDEQPKIERPVYRQEDSTRDAEQITPRAQTASLGSSPAAPVAATGGTDFRWPVRGRVISGFGAKPNGQTNDGVNISVPEGTEIKAAEGGVVAYAGNELKGFGNLVLIRHANEWVTAYAHASEILVKRGDVVRRGQVIARAGKTGNVSSPQLHFEVRRGASPVDPMNHLPQG